MAIANSFPAFHTTGPVHNYIRVGGYPTPTGNSQSSSPSGEIWYLGTCETTPILRLNRYGRPVFNDIGGRSVPMQETHDGEDADLGLLLSRFSQAAYIALQTFANSGAGQYEGGPGAESLISRGSLLYGPRTFELWQWFSFNGSPAATPGLPIGYYWPQVKLVNHSLETLGSEGEKVLIAGKATPRWIAPIGGVSNVTVSSTSGTGRFVLRSSNSSDFPSDVTQVR